MLTASVVIKEWLYATEFEVSDWFDVNLMICVNETNHLQVGGVRVWGINKTAANGSHIYPSRPLPGHNPCSIFPPLSVFGHLEESSRTVSSLVLPSLLLVMLDTYSLKCPGREEWMWDLGELRIWFVEVCSYHNALVKVSFWEFIWALIPNSHLLEWEKKKKKRWLLSIMWCWIKLPFQNMCCIDPEIHEEGYLIRVCWLELNLAIRFPEAREYRKFSRRQGGYSL